MLDVSGWLLHGSLVDSLANSFQSFLCWMCLADKLRRPQDAGSDGFNPSYAGCVWLMIQTQIQIQPLWCFNPSYAGCVWLIKETRFPNLIHICFNPSYAGCVWLIFLMVKYHFQMFCFNPSYAGCVWLIIRPIDAYLAFPWVSILLMLDVSGW